MNKPLKSVLKVVLAVLLIYASGPMPPQPKFENCDKVLNHIDDIKQLDIKILKNEINTPFLKKNNHARVIWADSTQKKKTPIAMVYLHGFTASQEEGNPTHKKLAQAFGCNLYLSRLDEHGVEPSEPLLKMSAENLFQTACDAIEIGKTLGDEVIVLGTSTGCTLALLYAARYKGVKAILNYSPNIEINNPAAEMLTLPWGLPIARMVYGGLYAERNCDSYEAQYWDCKHRLEAIIQLQLLLDYSMKPETFAKISIPVYTGYFYKNEKEQDKTVRVSAMRLMQEQLKTPKAQNWFRAYPEAGTHVISNGVKSGAISTIYEDSHDFLMEVVGLNSTDYSTTESPGDL
jgi:esterase/lipase